MNTNIFTYTGDYIQPHSSNKKTSLAFSTNNDRSILVIYIMSPGGFQDAYRIAAFPHFKDIVIVPISLDFLFISDVVRLQNALLSIKRYCKVLFPITGIRKLGNVPFQMNLIKSNSVNINNGEYPISINLTKSIDESSHYDINISDGNRNILIPAFMNDTYLLKLMTVECQYINEIHLPYIYTLYGGKTFLDIKKDSNYNQLFSKLKCNGFANETEEADCIIKYPSSIVDINTSSLIERGI